MYVGRVGVISLDTRYTGCVATSQAELVGSLSLVPSFSLLAKKYVPTQQNLPKTLNYLEILLRTFPLKVISHTGSYCKRHLYPVWRKSVSSCRLLLAQTSI